MAAGQAGAGTAEDDAGIARGNDIEAQRIGSVVVVADAAKDQAEPRLKRNQATPATSAIER